MAQWIKALVRSSDIPQKSVSSTSGEGGGERSERKHGDKDEDNSPKNVNNIHNNSSQKYRQVWFWFGLVFMAYQPL